MDLTRLARSQYGIVTRTQALAHISLDALRWRLERKHWRSVHPAVYATHAEPLDWMARAGAALLYCSPRAALAQESAAYLLDLDNRQPPLIAVAIPAGMRRKNCAGFTVRRRRRLETLVYKRLRVTSPAFTVLDVGGSPTASREDAIAIAARAVQRRKATVVALRRELEQRRAHRHREAIELSLGIVSEGAESVLEVEFGRRSLDIRRDRHTAAQGRVTLRAEWVDVRYEPCELAAQIFATLHSRGYQGVLSACTATCRAPRYVEHPA